MQDRLRHHRAAVEQRNEAHFSRRCVLNGVRVLSCTR
jgi:hypothetical protein